MTEPPDPRLLDHVAATWQRLAEEDPLWAVLTGPGKEKGGWDVREFFATGQRVVDEALDGLAANGLSPASRQRALDFGSGAGRISRALAQHFEGVDGVDIAPAMVEHARQLNADVGNLTFHVNRAADLSLFPSQTFDLVFSTITLQHMPPDAALAYIGEFIRVLKPGGVAVFDTASVSRTQRLKEALPRPFVVAARRALHRGRPAMEMFGLRVEDVQAAVSAAGGRIAASHQFWHGPRYAAVRT